MKRAPVWLIVPALLALSLSVRPEANRPAAATLPAKPGDGCAASPCRHIARDLPAAPPEQLPPPTPDVKPAEQSPLPAPDPEAAPAPPKQPRPDPLMVGPDGVIFRRTAP